MAKNVFTKDERKEQFIKSGIKLSRKSGVDSLSVAAVAADCKVTAPLIFHVFGNREKFRAAVKAAAKKQAVTLGNTPAPKRKRSVAEVKAIKNKAVPTPVKKPKKSFATLPVPSTESVGKSPIAKL